MYCDFKYLLLTWAKWLWACRREMLDKREKLTPIGNRSCRQHCQIGFFDSIGLWSPVGYWKCCTSNSTISKLFHSRLHRAENAKKIIVCILFINWCATTLATLFLPPFFLSLVQGDVPLSQWELRRTYLSRVYSPTGMKLDPGEFHYCFLSNTQCTLFDLRPYCENMARGRLG